LRLRISQFTISFQNVPINIVISNSSTARRKSISKNIVEAGLPKPILIEARRDSVETGVWFIESMVVCLHMLLVLFRILLHGQNLPQLKSLTLIVKCRL
jgi:hypothetical protein